jgi:N-acetylglucosaminyldiphosphoundecaprenol N-acetyl-beta-D-mannosaminyltransferase
MIDLTSVNFCDDILEDLSVEIMSNISICSFHFIAVSTLTAADLDFETFTKMSRARMICDSKYLSLFSGLFGAKVRQIRGLDFLQLVLKNSPSTLRHCFIGTTSSSMQSFRLRVKESYPNIVDASFHSLPFLDYKNSEDFAIFKDFLEIGKFDLVWVSLGSPKQDRVALYLSEKYKVKSVAIGAALDFLSGEKKEAPKLFRTLGGEWIFRLISEPHRLWRRYLYGNSKFLFSLFKVLVKRFFSFRRSPKCW